MSDHEQSESLLPSLVIGGSLGCIIAVVCSLIMTSQNATSTPATPTINFYYPSPQQQNQPPLTEEECLISCKVNDPCPDQEDGDQCTEGVEWLTCRDHRWVREAPTPRVEREATPDCIVGKWCDARGNPEASCRDASHQRLICCSHTLMPVPPSGRCPTRM